jgi:serine protease AprX
VILGGVVRRVCFRVVMLVAAAGMAEAHAEAYWVFLDHKIDANGHRAGWVSPASDASLDLPVSGQITRQLQEFGTLRTRSRWLNAISLDLPPNQDPDALSQLPFVTAILPVRSARRPTPLPVARAARPAAPHQEYGPSFEQLNLMGVPLLHARGLRGQGVRIAIMDTGFNWPDYRAFAHLTVVAERDFINDDDDVTDEVNAPVSGDEIAMQQAGHGTRILGLLAGNDPGQLIGVAPEAEYLLAKVEDLVRELPIEEDRWIAGIEWADSLGADVASVSLGYTDFDDGTGYVYGDLDGRTTLTAQAAQIAVSRGMVVVVSAGNEGNKLWHYITTPADAQDVIAVGAVHVQSAAIASFSSRGPSADGRIKPDIVAPGQFVYSVDGARASVPGTFTAEQYVRFNGTSASAPLAAGVAALVLQADPTLTPVQVNERIRSTAMDLGPVGPDTIFGYGLVQAPAAVGLGSEIPDQDRVLHPYPNPARGEHLVVYFPFLLTTSDQVSLSVFDGAGQLVAELMPQSWPAGSHLSAGQALAWPVPERLATGMYHYRLRADAFQVTGSVALIRD